jgi:hypothetical protein
MRERLADVRKAGDAGLRTWHGRTLDALMRRDLVRAESAGSMAFARFFETEAGKAVKL